MGWRRQSFRDAWRQVNREQNEALRRDALTPTPWRDSLRIATIGTGILGGFLLLRWVAGRYGGRSFGYLVVSIMLLWLAFLLFIRGMYWVTKLYYERRDRRRGGGNQE